MKSIIVASALAFQQVAGHALFQDLWVNGVDKSNTCVRLPSSNTPITNVGSNDIRCNAGTRGVAGKCAVSAGGTVTVEMHQQPGDRSCKNEAIGGAHYGPVLVYMSKVADASTADGSTGWFKVYENGWAAASSKGVGDNDQWGVKDMNACCGKVDVKIPAALAPGDYLLRAEVIALHTAGQANGAQFYVSCYQITVDGTGALSPPTVKFPGAYKSSDPGIKINIHAAVSTYTVPGPAVIAEGTTKVPGVGASCANKGMMLRGTNDIFDV